MTPAPREIVKKWLEIKSDIIVYSGYSYVMIRSYFYPNELSYKVENPTTINLAIKTENLNKRNFYEKLRKIRRCFYNSVKNEYLEMKSEQRVELKFNEITRAVPRIIDPPIGFEKSVERLQDFVKKLKHHNL